MKSAVVKRSILVNKHKTSISLEDAFWDGLKVMAESKQTTLSALVGDIDKSRQTGNLSSSLRLAVFAHFDYRGRGPLPLFESKQAPATVPA